MTDREPLDNLVRIVGGHINGPRDLKNPKWKPIYEWYFGRQHGVVDLAKLILPYMCPRRQDKLRELIKADEDHPQRKAWEHGSLIGYGRYRCECEPCKTRWKIYQRLYYQSKIREK